MVGFSEYYGFLSSLSNWASLPLNRLSSEVNMAVFSALLLGLIGAASPCQLSTNLSALSFFSRGFQEKNGILRSAFSYFVGKALVYTTLGALAVLLGLEVSRFPVWAMVTFRRLLGPLLIVMGVLLLGWVRPNWLMGGKLGRRLKPLAERSPSWGGFWLGIAFSLVFCPTLFLLFFAFLVPLSATSGAGFIYPAFFALGTTLPLHFLALTMALAANRLPTSIERVRRVEKGLRWGVAIVFILMGLNEVLLYWVLP